VRSFSISNEVDRDAISARIDDGVLTVSLPKVKEASARRITVN
jgi:HSP20 family molecular chaperone IbpA